MRDMYEELGEKFKGKLLHVASKFVDSKVSEELDTVTCIPQILELEAEGGNIFEDYHTSNSFLVLVGIEESELEEWRNSYRRDSMFSSILLLTGDERCQQYLQYIAKDNGLLYFEDWNGNLRLCVPEMKRIAVVDEIHNTIT